MKGASTLSLNPLIRSIMDNLRLILFFALAFIGLMLYQAWIQDYGPKQPIADQQVSDVKSPISNKDISSVPEASVENDSAASAPAGVPRITGSSEETPDQVIKVETDLLRIEIASRGGTIQKAYLLDYPVAPETPDVKFELLSNELPDFFIAQSGLIGGAKGVVPTHEAEYSAEQSSYVMTSGQDELKVTLSWKSATGVIVKKHFVFNRGSYLINVIHEVTNQSGEPLTARDYAQLQRSEPKKSSGYTTYTYTGAVYYTPAEKYEKVKFEEIAEKKLSVDSAGGWIAMIQHYFLGAWIPPKEEIEHFYTNKLSGPKYLIGLYSPSVTLANGSTHQFAKQLYVGPKLQDKLESIATGLELAVDYGWLTVIAQPIFWLLEFIHKWVGNWGWSIIILTIIIKAAFFKLSETSYKSMANMRKVTPRLQALKDRYGDDKQRLNQAMMEMYKKEKINPLGGCLPILVQIPVFIALYWVLLESVEMRQAPFILWIDNLSAKDPYFILPLIMGVSMFIQQKLNPAPPDPMQAKIMMSLPFVFTIFFAFFPSGLVLYWVVNNIISIAQQWYITSKIEKSSK